MHKYRQCDYHRCMCHILLMWDTTCSSLQSLCTYLPSQEAFPARFKSLHLVHQPWYISIVYKLAKPFIKPKFKDRVSGAVLSWSLLSQQSLVPADPHERLRHGSSAGTFPSRDTTAC